MAIKWSRDVSLRVSWKVWAKHLLKLTLSIGLLAYLLSKTDIDQVVDSIKMSPLYIIVGTFLLNVVAVVLVQSAVNLYTLRSEDRIPYGLLCRDNLSISFYTLFLPAGLTFLIRWKKYKKRGVGGHDSAAQVIFQKILQIWTSAIFMVLGLFAVRADISRDVSSELSISIVFLTLTSCVVAAFLIPIKVRGFRENMQGDLTVKSGGSISKRIRKIILGFVEACREFSSIALSNKLIVTALALFQQWLIVLGAWLIVDSLSPGVPIAALALVRSVVVILMLIPVSVAGIGFRELGFFGLLPLFGVSHEIALASSLLLFINSVYLGVFGGIFELLPENRTKTVE